jgi:hypothetical protein
MAPPSENAGLETAARMLKEFQLLADDLSRNKNAPLLGPRLFEEFRLLPKDGSGSFEPTGWLMFIGILRGDLPWFYEAGMDLYRALVAGDLREIAAAKERVLKSIQATQNAWIREVIGDRNPDLGVRLFNLPDLVDSYLRQLDPLISPPESRTS